MSFKDQADSLENTRDYNFSNFKLAIDFLFSGKTELSSSANRYLNRFNNSNQSFEVAIYTLSLPDLNEKLYYNAIQIIKSKLTFNFGNFINDYTILKSLQSTLIETIYRFRNYEKVYILSTLCQCYSLLTLFSFKLIPNTIQDLIFPLKNQEKTGNFNGIEYNIIVMFYLKHLSDIISDRDIVIDEDHLFEFKAYLQKLSIFTIQEIQLSIQILYNHPNKFINPTEKVRFSKYILSCLISWLELGIEKTILSSLITSFPEILEFIFNITEENMKSHKECICLLLCDASISSNIFKYRYEDSKTKVEGQENIEKLNFSVIEKVIQMKPLVAKAIESKNEEGITFFIDIFEALCSNNIKLIITNKNIELLLIMYELTKVCNLDRIMYICDFWCETINCLVLHNDDPHVFISLIDDVINEIIRKSKWKTSIFEELNKEKYSKMKKNEEFEHEEDKRVYIKEFFTRISNIIPSIEIINKYIKPSFSIVCNDLKENSQSIKLWNSFESLVFILHSVIKNLKLEEFTQIDDIFQVLLNVPLEISQISRSITDFIDEVKEMLSINPNSLTLAFQYLVKGLSLPLIRKCMIISLNTLISSNKLFFSSKIQDLGFVYKTQIQDFLLKEDSSIEFLKSFCDVIFTIDNPDHIQLYFIEMCSPWIGKLFEISKVFSEDSSLLENKPQIEEFREILHIIKFMINSAYDAYLKDKSKSVSPLINKIFIEIWPAMRIIFNIPSDILVEASIQILKFFMRILKEQFLPYIDEFLKIIVTNYQVHPFCSYLYCFEITITVFGHMTSGDSFNYLQYILTNLYDITFNKYLTTPIQIANNPQLTNEVFGLLFRCIKINPILILGSDRFESIISTAIHNIDIKHPDTAINILNFLKKFLNFQSNQLIKELNSSQLDVINKKVLGLMNSMGETLVYKIFLYIQDVPLEAIFENLQEVLSSVIYKYDNSIMWFSSTIEKISENKLTNSEKVKFIKYVNDYQTYRILLKKEESEELYSAVDNAEEKIDSYLKLLYKRSLSLYKRE